MKLIEKIFFDLDGVLADFDERIFSLCGRYPENSGKGGDEYIWDAMRSDDHAYGSR